MEKWLKVKNKCTMRLPFLLALFGYFSDGKGNDKGAG